MTGISKPTVFIAVLDRWWKIRTHGFWRDSRLLLESFDLRFSLYEGVAGVIPRLSIFKTNWAHCWNSWAHGFSLAEHGQLEFPGSRFLPPPSNCSGKLGPTVFGVVSNLRGISRLTVFTLRGRLGWNSATNDFRSKLGLPLEFEGSRFLLRQARSAGILKLTVLAAAIDLHWKTGAYGFWRGEQSPLESLGLRFSESGTASIGLLQFTVFEHQKLISILTGS